MPRYRSVDRRRGTRLDVSIGRGDGFSWQSLIECLMASGGFRIRGQSEGMPPASEVDFVSVEPSAAVPLHRPSAWRPQVAPCASQLVIITLVLSMSMVPPTSQRIGF